MKLDLNRGVMHKFHPSGMRVSMYMDDPGAYLTDNGDPIAAEIAKEAGYDTEKLKREKLKALKLAEYKRQLEAEMRVEEDAIALAASRSSDVDVRHVGGGQYAIFSRGADGKQLTKVLMSQADLEMLGIAVPQSLISEMRSDTPDRDAA